MMGKPASEAAKVYRTQDPVEKKRILQVVHIFDTDMGHLIKWMFDEHGKILFIIQYINWVTYIFNLLGPTGEPSPVQI